MFEITNAEKLRDAYTLLAFIRDDVPTTTAEQKSGGFFQCKAYTHDGDIAVSDRVPVRTYDFQNLVKGYKS